MTPRTLFDWLFVDECQDLNVLQQVIAEKHLRPGGRILLVGDPRQAIYGFAGADAESFSNLQHHFDAEVLELNICYRCGKEHIRLAQSLVPSIEAHDGAIEGKIEHKNLDKSIATMSPGSMLMCRLNAPLVSAYFKLIASETPSIILGRDMAKNLIGIIENVAKLDGFNYAHIDKYLDAYFKLEKQRISGRPNSEYKIAELTDSIDCLQACASGFDCDDLECFKNKLEGLFVDAQDRDYDKQKVVTLCTVHKAKGLEADHVGIIYQRYSPGTGWSDIMPLSWEGQRPWEAEQERNIMYVAFTRPKQTLTILGGYDEAKDHPLPTADVGFDRDDLVIESIETGESITVSAEDLGSLAKQLPYHAGDEVEIITTGKRAIVKNCKPNTVTVVAGDDWHTLNHNEVRPIEAGPVEEINTDNVSDDESAPELPAVIPPDDPKEWALWMLEHNALIVDFETTNTYRNTTDVHPLSIAIRRMSGALIYHEYIYPVGVTIPEEATAIHGIDLDKLVTEQAKPWQAIVGEINEILGDAKAIVAYNSFFDERVYRDTQRLYDTAIVSEAPWYCAMKKYAQYNDSKVTAWGDRGGWWKLSEAIEQEQIAMDTSLAHDAAVDTEMTRQVILAMAADHKQAQGVEPLTLAETVEEPVTVVESAPEPVERDPYEAISTIFRDNLTLEQAKDLYRVLGEVIKSKEQE